MPIKEQLLALINPLLIITVGVILASIIPGLTLSEFLIINVVINLHLLSKEIKYKSKSNTLIDTGNTK